MVNGRRERCGSDCPTGRTAEPISDASGGPPCSSLQNELTGGRALRVVVEQVAEAPSATRRPGSEPRATDAPRPNTNT
jgi:hypothetical protein